MVAVLLFAILALSGCKADALLTVKVAENGSGTVTVRVALDPAAVQAAEVGGGSLDQRVRLADLAQNGWTVTPWVRSPDGSAVITLEKPFARSQDAGAVIAEVMGVNGPVRDAAVTRDQGLVRTTTEFSATGDVPGATLDVARDSQLAAVLGAAGLDPNAVDQQLANRLRDATTFRVRVNLAGEQRSWTLPRDRRVPLRAENGSVTMQPVVWWGLAALLGGAGMLVLLSGRRRSGRDTAPGSARA